MFFCHSIVKRIIHKENITYEMIRDHNDDCKKFNIINKNYEDNLFIIMKNLLNNVEHL